LGLFVICVGCSYFVLRIDWAKESINAQNRSEKTTTSTPSETPEIVEMKPFLEVSQDEDTSTSVDTSVALEEGTAT
jgi:hypothetical protein